MPRRFLLFATLILFAACRNYSTSDRVIVLQPLGGFTTKEAHRIRNGLLQHFRVVQVKEQLELPSSAFYRPRGRYRADSLLHMLKQLGSADTVVVGLLHEDISTAKGDHADWGVMGLGYRPGNACVVSSFRLSKSNRAEQFYKVVIHELGHTQGLPHCPERTCFMRDAEGGNPLNQENSFCVACSSFLKGKGWQLK